MFDKVSFISLLAFSVNNFVNSSIPESPIWLSLKFKSRSVLLRLNMSLNYYTATAPCKSLLDMFMITKLLSFVNAFVAIVFKPSLEIALSDMLI